MFHKFYFYTIIFMKNDNFVKAIQRLGIYVKYGFGEMSVRVNEF